ncbi:MAG TPA: single-stranded-DNA-specific exonuclease RecJ [Planctomycetes bacterium]|nr:single-stranded-DNA-specific exonuclease RecJ [Planctomycetota bacterium]
MVQWRRKTPDPAAVRTLVVRERLPEVLAHLLVNRGHDSAEAVRAHLEASPMQLHDPFLFEGMDRATERLARAIRDGETILVHGDYDVDGVTGTSLLMLLLELVGAKAVWHIPNRLVDGYSFGAHSVERARSCGASVVISVDNGTSAADVIRDLAAIGVDTIVTDHHEPPPDGTLPDAVAILNPKLSGSTYPWRELCGGAMAFKLAWGLVQHLSDGSSVRRARLKEFLEEATAYVAIATVCDVVPLLDENRVFARYGLKALAQSKAPGLRALVEVAGIAGRRLSAEDVAFQIGPRINASGRLGSAHQAVECLLARDPATARRFAVQLDTLNKKRREIEREVLVEARAQAGDFPADPVLVVAGQGWHQGVVGIVAARLTEEFGKPAIVIGLDGERGRGSARTVGSFSILEAMSGAEEHLERFGGHTQAAGLEIRSDRVADARAAIVERAREMLERAPLGEEELWVDCELPFPSMNEDTMRHIDRLAPFGERNETPVFLSRGVHLAEPAREVGAEGGHLMLRLRDGAHVLRAMAFRQGSRLGELRLGTPIDVVYSPRWNTFRGRTNLELQVHDFSPAGGRPG